MDNPLFIDLSKLSNIYFRLIGNIPGLVVSPITVYVFPPFVNPYVKTKPDILLFIISSIKGLHVFEKISICFVSLSNISVN